jgi:hypothetical protein
LLQCKARAEALEQKTEELLVRLDAAKAEVANLQRVNHDLHTNVEHQRSLKTRVWALFNQGGSVDMAFILRSLGRTNDRATADEVLSVLGVLVDEGKIEGDPYLPQGSYRLKS